MKNHIGLCPVIGFHGVKDNVIPFNDIDNSQDRYFSILYPYKKENYCFMMSVSGTYKIKKQKTDPVWISQCSSQNIYNWLLPTNLNRYAELYVDCDQKHGQDANSDFGLSSPSEDDIKKYIAQRAAIFFQKMMRHGIDIGLSTHPPFDDNHTTLFQGCENKRKCGVAENNTCDTDSCTIETE
ncbi:MAG TPA: hypothetical protein PLA68_12520 [Panacibacter sp.]|nr:hypothetical protein [Panacibacter sp.]